MLKALNQPEYVHILINHLPLTGLLVSLIALILALLRRKRTSIMIGLLLAGIFAGSVWPVIYYGEKGYERVLPMADEDGTAYLKHHMALGNRWAPLYYITSLAAFLGLLTSWKFPRYMRISSSIVSALTILSLIAGATIAEFGGKIRHQEFRTGPPPSTAGMEHEHKGGGIEMKHGAAQNQAPLMSGQHSMGGEAAMTSQNPDSSKDPDAMQLEASRLQLEASRLQLEVSRMQLEKAGLEASSPSNQTMKAESSKAVQPAHHH